MLCIDVNCDMGEGIGNDALIMPWITSANVACGLHAGDDATMEHTIALASRYNVAIGAHPSFDDREHFGRTEMHLPVNELYHLLYMQVQRAKTIAGNGGTILHHVKPHGALYNMAARDEQISRVIVRAVKDVDAGLVLYGLSGSHLISEAKKAGLRTASEVFADRTYREDGSLTPRSEQNALIEDENDAIQQVLRMVMERKVVTTSGKAIVIDAETICLHGDGIHAVAFAKKIHETLKQKGIALQTI